jgi:hypothetical protein
MAANTRAGRRSGSFKRSQEAISDISQRNKGSAKSYNKRMDYVKDRRIYTVLVSTRGGTSVYKAWEHSDDKMNDHFGAAEAEGKRFFSFTDIREKTLTNVDLHAGWRYKMTLRWNPEKDAHDGSKGDWQDVRQWYSERDSKREAARNVPGNRDIGQQKIKPSRFSALGKDIEVEEISPRVLADGDIADMRQFPSLKVVINTEGKKDDSVVKIHTSSGVKTLDSWSDGEEKDDEETTENDGTVAALEKEKAELLALLDSEEE